jgi:HD superfamily phosphohydrolase
MNKRKIVNDPIYGLINIRSELLFDIMEHPYFQRLRRIKQLGLTDYVYPGATHTRFEHVLGATYLMNSALDELKGKGYKISYDEKEGAGIAILLHDLGHGPFSHTLEHSFMRNIAHEDISLKFMEAINKDFGGKLQLGIEIFKNTYHKKYLHKLVSGQLDMDRLDYLQRDSFFTGVSEGVIGSERIIKMLQIHDDDIAVEEKGIYSVEKFLIARRLMYWQVYLHKTVVAAEQMLVKTIARAKYAAKDNGVFATPALGYFFDNDISDINDLDSGRLLPTPLEIFAKLDDSDIIVSLKEWMNSEDKILAFLSSSVINRRLFKIEISNKPFDESRVRNIKNKAENLFRISGNDIDYLVFTDTVSNKAYNPSVNDRINILKKNNTVADIAEASDISNVSALSQKVEKFLLCYPKECAV